MSATESLLGGRSPLVLNPDCALIPFTKALLSTVDIGSFRHSRAQIGGKVLLFGRPLEAECCVLFGPLDGNIDPATERLAG
jgi:hypothetical protein